MPLGMLWWMIFVLWFIFGLWWNWPSSKEPRGFGPIGGNLILFILLFMLGWRVFGFVVQ